MAETEQSVKDAKLVRGQKKGIVTKAIGAVYRYMAEEDNEEVISRLRKLKDSFDIFEKAHDSYHNMLDNPDEVELSDTYFITAQDEYTKVLVKSNAWLKQREFPTEQSSKSSDHDINTNLVSVLSLPKVEIESFDGDPLKYHKFIALFEESVEKLVKDDKVRLTRLLQYTTGSAKQAIQGCILIDGDSGYKQARDILCQRFGNKHLVVNRILNSLRFWLSSSHSR